MLHINELTHENLHIKRHITQSLPLVVPSLMLRLLHKLQQCRPKALLHESSKQYSLNVQPTT
jgi:hypothetical protein